MTRTCGAGICVTARTTSLLVESVRKGSTQDWLPTLESDSRNERVSHVVSLNTSKQWGTRRARHGSSPLHVVIHSRRRANLQSSLTVSMRCVMLWRGVYRWRTRGEPGRGSMRMDSILTVPVVEAEVDDPPSKRAG